MGKSEVAQPPAWHVRFLRRSTPIRARDAERLARFPLGLERCKQSREFRDHLLEQDRVLELGTQPPTKGVPTNIERVLRPATADQTDLALVWSRRSSLGQPVIRTLIGSSTSPKPSSTRSS